MHIAGNATAALQDHPSALYWPAQSTLLNISKMLPIYKNI